MTEVDAQPYTLSALVETPFAGSSPTAGSLLREARIAAGAHLESIAFSLKVPVVKIDALERDDVSAFPDATFMRALASSVCRLLRVDSAPVLALMPQSTQNSLGLQNESTRPTFRDPLSSRHSSAWPGRSSLWLMVLVLLLLLGAAAVAFIPQDWKLPSFLGGASTSASDAVISDEVDADTNANIPSVVMGVGTPLQASSLETSNASDLAVSGVPGLQTPIPAGEAAEPIPQPSIPPRLSFSARGETWIKVMDGRGKVLLERNLKKGDSVSVNDPGLLSVVIGRADVTDVRVGANARDIIKNARDNVARFEVLE